LIWALSFGSELLLGCLLHFVNSIGHDIIDKNSADCEREKMDKIMIFKNEDFLTELLEWVALISISVMLLFRLYAAFVAQPVVGYDDRHYKGLAKYFEVHKSAARCIKDFLLPNTEKLGNRTIGYQSYLIIGLKFFKQFDADRVIHGANVVLYLFQLCFVYLIARWIWKEPWFACSMVFLYMSMPIVFGVNRWIVTENYVFSGVLAFAFFSLAMVLYRPELRGQKWFGFVFKEILIPAGCAYGMALFSTLREYAFPCFIAAIFVVAVMLIWSKRWVALVVFFAVIYPFVSAGFGVCTQIINKTVEKTGILPNKTDPNVVKYAIPMIVWIRMLIIDSFGPAMAVFTLGGSVWILSEVWRIFCGEAKTMIDKVKWLFKDINLFFIVQGFLSAVFLGVVFLSQYKECRTTILPIVCVFLFFLYGIRVSGIFLQKNRKLFFKKVLFVVILLAWGTQVYQLFFAFGGGKEFAIRPYYLPTYNHPFGIRELNGPGDTHIIE